MNWYIITQLAISPPKQNGQLGALLEGLSTVGISLHVLCVGPCPPDPVTPVAPRLPNLIAAAPTETPDLQKRMVGHAALPGGWDSAHRSLVCSERCIVSTQDGLADLQVTNVPNIPVSLSLRILPSVVSQGRSGISASLLL